MTTHQELYARVKTLFEQGRISEIRDILRSLRVTKSDDEGPSFLYFCIRSLDWISPNSTSDTMRHSRIAGVCTRIFLEAFHNELKADPQVQLHGGKLIDWYEWAGIDNSLWVLLKGRSLFEQLPIEVVHALANQVHTQHANDLGPMVKHLADAQYDFDHTYAVIQSLGNTVLDQARAFAACFIDNFEYGVRLMLKQGCNPDALHPVSDIKTRQNLWQLLSVVGIQSDKGLQMTMPLALLTQGYFVLGALFALHTANPNAPAIVTDTQSMTLLEFVDQWRCTDESLAYEQELRHTHACLSAIQARHEAVSAKNEALSALNDIRMDLPAD